MQHWKALGALLIAPLVLTACLFVPGKFVSTLDVRADRSFTFTYKGEVNAVDVAGMMTKSMAGLGEAMKEDGDGAAEKDSAPPSLEPTAEEQAKKDAEYRELAVKLAKEAGYRSVEYRGKNVFYVDYAISGRLTHNFTFPFNQDAAMIFPFVAIELRGKDTVRVKAPGFAKQDDSAAGGMGGMGAGSGADDPASKLDGTFTLTTDAEIVSQNNEDGATAQGTAKSISWKVSPLTQDAPMAVLRVAGL